MLGLCPIASAPIAALPDYLVSRLQVTFAAFVTYEAVAISAYAQLAASAVRIVYTMELSYRRVR